MKKKSPQVTVRISRYTGGHQHFFGSDLKQSGGVTLEICIAESSERYGEEHIYGHSEGMLQIRMTHNQFAQMITTLNCGTGTPATLEYFDGVKVEEYVNETTVIERHTRHLNETKERLKERIHTLKDLIKEIGEIPHVSKKVKDKLNMALEMVLQEYESNIPFVLTQTQEDMESVVQRGMTDIECYLDTRLNQLGREALGLLKDQVAPILIDKEKEEVRDGELTKKKE